MFQVKIWFQNRRTKWKKQDNISNAEAAEHKNQNSGKQGAKTSGGKSGDGKAGSDSAVNLVKAGGGEHSPGSVEDHSNTSLFTPDGSISESCFTATPPPGEAFAQSPGELMAARRLDPGSTPELLASRRIEPCPSEFISVRRIEATPPPTDLMAVRRNDSSGDLRRFEAAQTFTSLRRSPAEFPAQLLPSPQEKTGPASNEAGSPSSQSPGALVIADCEELAELRGS